MFGGTSRIFCESSWAGLGVLPNASLSREGSVESLCTEGMLPRESPFWFLPHAPGGSSTLFAGLIEGQGSFAMPSCDTTSTHAAQAPQNGGCRGPSWLPGREHRGEGDNETSLRGLSSRHRAMPLTLDLDRQLGGLGHTQGLAWRRTRVQGAFPSNSAVEDTLSHMQADWGFLPLSTPRQAANQATKPMHDHCLMFSLFSCSPYPGGRRPTLTEPKRTEDTGRPCVWLFILQPLSGDRSLRAMAAEGTQPTEPWWQRRNW